MIQVNELRIGNWVQKSGGMIRCENVCDVGINIYPIDESGGWCQPDLYLDQIEPIPLTSELLQKAGFKKSYDFVLGHQTAYEKDNVIINENFQMANDEGTIGIPLKYVHQLQNLYFALTGQELPIQF